MSFEDIIDKVKTHPELWQSAHPLYKIKLLRQKIWNQISKELNTDGSQLKKSWKYLNDQFRREYKKINSLSTYAGKPIPCGWAYYERLSFLKRELASRRDRRPARIVVSSDSDTAVNESTTTHESITTHEPTTTHESTTTHEQTTTHESTTHEPFPTLNQDEMTEESFQQEDNDDYMVPSYNHENAQKYSIPKQHIKKSKPGPSRCSKVTKADLILRRLQNISSVMARSQLDAMQNDEDSLFFMSILPMVRTLSQVKKLQLRGKINEWLLQSLSGEADPLRNVEHYMVPVHETCEDNKEAIMKQIMEAEDDD